ncbi:MAG: hypothetical protein ISP86_04950 [Shewanellaceae bacterium]|nr:hypothetical protein [Shewanellaceae bacterium]
MSKVLIDNGGSYASFYELLDDLNKVYAQKVTPENLSLCLVFLFTIGKVEIDDETHKIVLR